MNPPEFLGLKQRRRLSRCVVPEFLAKFSVKSRFQWKCCCLEVSEGNYRLGFVTKTYSVNEVFNKLTVHQRSFKIASETLEI